MKATIEFDDELYRQLKAAAALRGKKVRELVEEGVRAVLSPSWVPVEKRRKVVFPIIKDRGKPVAIPPDAVARMDEAEDRDRYAKFMR